MYYIHIKQAIKSYNFEETELSEFVPFLESAQFIGHIKDISNLLIGTSSEQCTSLVFFIILDYS